MFTTLLCVGGYCVALCGSVAAGATLKAAQNHWNSHCPACARHEQEELAAKQRVSALLGAIEQVVAEVYGADSH